MSSALIIVLIILVGGIMYALGYFFSIRIREKKIVSVKELAGKIIEEAKREAETVKKSATLESKELLGKMKND